MTLYLPDGTMPITEKEIPIFVHIRYNPLGEIRIYEDIGWLVTDDYVTDVFNDFIWQEGNYSCDCNRCLFFKRVKDEDESECGCGDNKYSVRIYDKDNNLLYTDFEEDQ